ncbi:unnamed protein product [Closterium sp. NIES-65]|nr:unnamed protein product [Closterium sp. NIES-65]
MASSSPGFLFKHPPFVLLGCLLLAFLFQSHHPMTRAGVTSGDGGAVYGEHENCGEFGREDTKSAVASEISGVSRVTSRAGSCRADGHELREAEARAVAAEERARLAEGRAEELDAELRGALGDVARLESAITEMGCRSSDILPVSSTAPYCISPSAMCSFRLTLHLPLLVSSPHGPGWLPEEQLAVGEKRCGEKQAEVGRQLKECNGGRQRAMAQLHECGEKHLVYHSTLYDSLSVLSLHHVSSHVYSQPTHSHARRSLSGSKGAGRMSKAIRTNDGNIRSCHIVPYEPMLL